MKVYMKKNITAYSGLDKDEHVVYNSLNEGNVCITRKTFEYVPNAHSAAFSAQMNNIQALWALALPEYKQQLKEYELKRRKLYLNNTLKRGGNYGMFVKMVFAYAKAENANLATVTITELRASTIKTLASAIDAEFLPKVDGYELYTAIL